MFASPKSLTKIESLHKKALRFILTIIQVPTKEYWKNLVNFPCALKENINSTLRYVKL